MKGKKRNSSNSIEKSAKSRQHKRSKSRSRDIMSNRRHRSRSRSNSRDKKKRNCYGKQRRTRSGSRSRNRRDSRSKQRKNSKTFSSRSRSPNKSSSPLVWRKKQRSLSSRSSPSRNSQSSSKRKTLSRSKTPQRRHSSGGKRKRPSPRSKTPTIRVPSPDRRKSTPERKRKRSFSTPESPVRRSRSLKRKREHNKRPTLEQTRPRGMSLGSKNKDNRNSKRTSSKKNDSDEESSYSSSSDRKSPVRVKRDISVLRSQLKADESVKKISRSDRKDSTGFKRKHLDEEVSDGKSSGKKPPAQKLGDSGAIQPCVWSTESVKQNSGSDTQSTRHLVKISFSYSDESDKEFIDRNSPDRKSPAVEKTDNITLRSQVKLAESTEIKCGSDHKDSESLKEISACKALDELEAKSSDVRSPEGKSPVLEKKDSLSAFKSQEEATESTKEKLGSDHEDFGKVPVSSKIELDEESADSESLGKMSPVPESTDGITLTSQIESTEPAKQQSPAASPTKLEDDDFDFVFTGHLTPKQGSEKSVEDMLFAEEPLMSDSMMWDVKMPASTAK